MKNSFLILSFLGLFLSSCDKEQVIFVADHFAVCDIPPPQQCLLLKEKESDTWTTYADGIEGFTYEEGYEYKLKVKVQKNEKSALKYVLVKIISKKETVATIYASEINKNLLFDTWHVFEISGFENQTGVNPYFSLSKRKIIGHNGCNNFGGDMDLSDDGTVKIEGVYSTKMFCSETANLEFAFSTAVRSVAKFQIENNQLCAYDAKGKLLFKADKKESQKAGSIDSSDKLVPNKSTDMQEKSGAHSAKYMIKYTASTRNYHREWTYNGKTIEVQQMLPTKEKKSVVISEKDRLNIEELVGKLDFNKLETLTPPSTKHQFDGAKHAAFELQNGTKTYYVPTFDDGNPPTYIKVVLEKLNALTSK